MESIFGGHVFFYFSRLKTIVFTKKMFCRFRDVIEIFDGAIENILLSLYIFQETLPTFPGTDTSCGCWYMLIFEAFSQWLVVSYPKVPLPPQQTFLHWHDSMR